MECEDCKCKNIIAGQAFTKYTCQECDQEFMHHHTAVPKVCKECSEEYNLCERCGKYIGIKMKAEEYFMKNPKQLEGLLHIGIRAIRQVVPGIFSEKIEGVCPTAMSEVMAECRNSISENRDVNVAFIQAMLPQVEVMMDKVHKQWEKEEKEMKKLFGDNNGR